MANIDPNCRYMENKGEGAFVKPWVWILWIAGGPLIESVVFQLYIFLSVGVVSEIHVELYSVLSADWLARAH